MSRKSRSKVPGRLIDPEGEGVYMNALNHEWSLRGLAWDFFADARQWRDFNWEYVYLREDDEGYWHRVKPRRWHDMLLPFRWAPKPFHYITPKPEAL